MTLAFIATFVAVVIGTQPSPSQLQAALDAMSSASFETRKEGTAQLDLLIDTDESILASDDVAEHVAALLEREASAFEASLALGHPPGTGGQREFFGDDLTELTARWLRRSAPLSPRFLRAAVRLPHNAFSPFTRLVARHGAPAVPAALALATAENSQDRIGGYSLIGELFRANYLQSAAVPLTEAQRSALLDRLRQGLGDQEAWARKAAIEATVMARDKGAIPILTLLANTDPDDGAGRQAWFPSVRSVAAAAVKSLSQ